MESDDRRTVNWEAFRYYDRLRRVRDRLEQSISEPLDIATASEIAGLSPGYFSTFFREKVGARFVEWQQLVRVRRAQETIRHRNYAITEVARRVGFRDLRSFERAFKRHAGMTAVEYKRRVRPKAATPDRDGRAGVQ